MLTSKPAGELKMGDVHPVEGRLQEMYKWSRTDAIHVKWEHSTWPYQYRKHEPIELLVADPPHPAVKVLDELKELFARELAAAQRCSASDNDWYKGAACEMTWATKKLAQVREKAGV
jgi:hypothetical protein